MRLLVVEDDRPFERYAMLQSFNGGLYSGRCYVKISGGQFL